MRATDVTAGSVIYVGNGREYDLHKLDKHHAVHQEGPADDFPGSLLLDPRMTVFDIISEPLRANYRLPKKEVEERVKDAAARVGLNPSYLKRYPHAFSGGQRQRIGIARALVLYPRIIVCDEPVSALDVSVQAQVVNLLKDLQKELDLTYIFISHDLSVVEYISDKVGVMYLGKMVEFAPTGELFKSPRHPYTEALLSAVPIADPTVTGTVFPGNPRPVKSSSGLLFPHTVPLLHR